MSEMVVTKTTRLFNGYIFNIDRQYYNNGVWRDVVTKNSAAHIVAVDNEGNVLMILEHRAGSGQVSYSLPAGHIEDGEDPMKAAIRECQEETGFRPQKIEQLIHPLYSSEGWTNEQRYLFYATDLVRDELPLDEDETIISLVYVPFAEAIQMALTDKSISGIATVTALLLAERKFHGK